MRKYIISIFFLFFFVGTASAELMKYDHWVFGCKEDFISILLEKRYITEISKLSLQRYYVISPKKNWEDIISLILQTGTIYRFRRYDREPSFGEEPFWQNWKGTDREYIGFLMGEMLYYLDEIRFQLWNPKYKE